MNSKEEKQVKMHKGFFDRCNAAIENGFYLEAILMEYAAIESRLEAICGTIGFPCGRTCSNRKDIKISTRIECLRVYKNNNSSVFLKTKLQSNFFSGKGILKNWIDGRDRIVHGLYKDELKYISKINESKELAEKGYKYSKLLYNEAKRIRRLKKYHPDVLNNAFLQCQNSNCKGDKGVL